MARAAKGEVSSITERAGGQARSHAIRPAEESADIHAVDSEEHVNRRRSPNGHIRSGSPEHPGELQDAIGEQRLSAMEPLAAGRSQDRRDDKPAPFEVRGASGPDRDISLHDSILAAVAHDLRNPLAAIKAAVTSLLSHEVDWHGEAARGLAETIDHEADRLALLLESLLDARRVKTGVATALLAPIVLEDVLYDTVTSLAPAGSSVTIEITDTLPAVAADRGLLERSIANVISNAIVWSPPEAAVDIAAAVVGERVHVRVSDHGPGIPYEHRERVFLPFRTLGRPADKCRGGVGLGLAVARGFTEAIGGLLTIEDTPGGGATLVFSLQTAGHDRHGRTPT